MRTTEGRVSEGQRLQRLLGDDAPGAGLTDLGPPPAPELDLEGVVVRPVPARDQRAVRALLARLDVPVNPCPACGADDGDHWRSCPIGEGLA